LAMGIVVVCIPLDGTEALKPSVVMTGAAGVTGFSGCEKRGHAYAAKAAATTNIMLVRRIG
jgi:hypothetical protein